MALSKDVLGAALYARREAFCNKTLEQLVTDFGSLDAVKLAMAKADAEEIINHFKTYAVISVNVTTTGTAAAHTGTGTGTISN